MDEANPVSTPMSNGEKFSKTQQSTERERDNMKKIPYQEAIDSLLFASQISRPDITFAVFRYLRGTSSYKLKIDGLKTGPIYGYCDADWASGPDERRSVTGYLYFHQVRCPDILVH
ncbi:uncharacterized protein [Halyomorpha halys]|uniref:uncharacterized protein n=1 Tax=Halyomorpha halys TaxID=286706 RepID=UPI0034D24603